MKNKKEIRIHSGGKMFPCLIHTRDVLEIGNESDALFEEALISITWPPALLLIGAAAPPLLAAALPGHCSSAAVQQSSTAQAVGGWQSAEQEG